MLFNSFVFIFLFLPIVFFTYFALNKLRNKQVAIYWLVITSLFFYGYFEPRYLIIISFSIITNYLFSRFINKTVGQVRLAFMIVGIIFNIAILGYYKYADFFIANVNQLFGTDYHLLHLLLPLGISFVTFQQIAFLVDSYRYGTSEYKFANYTLFVTFFPQLIAGPIVQHDEMLPQYDIKENRSVILENVAKGIFIFVIGLAKKIVVADTAAVWANDGFMNYESLTFIEAWITSLSYTIQLYFDFSGYCDMAIGLGLMFNIKLPINFNSPYKARNIQEFWKKWHMTLNRFLTVYVYFPLGGSKKGITRTYVNILIIFFISGFWHGAGWTFIIWGLLHGIASVIVRLFEKTKIKLPFIISWFITFMFVNFAWVFFRATSIEQAQVIIKKMLTPSLSSVNSFFSLSTKNFNLANSYEIVGISLGNPYVIVLFLVVALTIALLARNSIQLTDSMQFNWQNIVLIQIMIMAVLVTIFYMQKNSEFLYFNF